MSVYNEFLDTLKNRSIPIIPNQLARVGNIFNIVQGRYTLVGSVSGVGKTSFVDDDFLLKPYEWLQVTKSDIYFEGLYFSMERQVRAKLAKITSWLLFVKHGIRLSSEIILGNNPFRKVLPEEQLFIDKLQPWMDAFLEMVDIKDGRKTVNEIKQEIELLGKRLGFLITTDINTVFIDGVEKLKFKGEVIATRKGNVPIVRFNFQDKSYVMKQNSRLFVPKNEKYIITIIVDHVGKIKEDGYIGKKQAIDALDAVLSDARDVYNFNPIAISQFNRSLSDITRLKYSKGNLEPLYEDFKDTGNTVESADLVLSLFNPYKYGSYDSEGFYKGYDIKRGLLTPDGNQRFRSLHILKNSYGVSDVSFGLKFLGECMYFSTLPRPDDLPNLQAVYEKVQVGL